MADRATAQAMAALVMSGTQNLTDRLVQAGDVEGLGDLAKVLRDWAVVQQEQRE